MQIHGHDHGAILALKQRLSDHEVSLRWGGPQIPGAINGTVHLLDAREQLEAFKSHEIPCPDFTFDRAEAESWVREGAIVLGRKFNHSQGKDIVISGNRWAQRDFWTKYLPSISEWRFHILHSESFARGRKVWAGNGPEPTAAPIIRSRRLGWHLAHNIEPPKGARSLAKLAVAAVGYDLGAVDLIEVTRGKYIVLEVNSRPAIRDPYTIERYAKAFGAL